MAQKFSAGMPDNLDLPANWIVRFAALSPTTGAAVAGVNVSGASLLVANVSGGDLAAGPFEVVDLTWLNVPVEDTTGP